MQRQNPFSPLFEDKSSPVHVKLEHLKQENTGRVILSALDLGIVSVKEPPTETDDFDLIKAKLIDLIKSLSDKKDTIFTTDQQEKLLIQVNTLIYTPPFVLFNIEGKEKTKAENEHKKTLIDVYHVINDPQKNFPHFQENLQKTKEQGRTDKFVGILSTIAGIVGCALTCIFAAPTGGLSAFIGVPASMGLLFYGLYKFKKTEHSNLLGELENTIESGLKRNTTGG